MCALDLPGEHAEDDDLGEPDPTYFGSHPDELEARPTGFLLFLLLGSTILVLHYGGTDGAPVHGVMEWS